MYFQYSSDSLTKLADHFLDLFGQSNPENAFQKKWIIVQNREMQEWLTLREAEKHKISANNQFVFPSEFIWKLYRLCEPEFPSVLPSDKNPMLWSIYGLLRDKEGVFENFEFDLSSDETQLYQLSKAIADVFDQYQVYRPELLKNWEQGNFSTSHSSEKWQLRLWQQLNAQWDQEKAALLRSDVFFELKELLQRNNFPFEKLPEDLWIFNLPHISKPFAEVIALLSKRINVHLFIGHHEQDKSDTNQISSKLTQAHQNNMSVLMQVFKGVDETIRKIDLHDQSGNSESKLEVIRNLISGFTEPEIPSDELKQNFEIHSCHSKRRELEVLKDKLLSKFNAAPSLKPENCMILVPALDQYSSLITEIFSDEDFGTEIPVSRFYNSNSGFASKALIQLNRLLISDFKITDVLDVIENPVVIEKWAFTDDELSLIRKWMSELKVHRQLKGDRFSILNGLDRLFLGFGMEPDKFKMFGGKAVYPKIFNSDSGSLMAKLSSFLRTLEKWSKSLEGYLTLEQWLKKTKKITQQILWDEKAENGVSQLISELESLHDQVVLSGFKDEIDASLFFSWLHENLSASNSNSAGFGHGVNISEYVPNRNIPYKFVGILGLNADVIPAKKLRPDFDLIYRFPQPGDRIHKWEQNFVFYDLIQSAREYLHISYVGVDEQTNTAKEPSILLQQILYEAKSVGIEIPVVQEKLHGFDKEYFITGEESSYAENYRRISQAEESNTQTGFIENTELEDFETEVVSEEIALRDLISFFSHPAKHLCSNWLSVSNYDNESEPESRESFKLDGLEHYFLKDYLSDAFLKEYEISELKELAKASNLIPEGYPGDKEFFENELLIQQLSEVQQAHNLKEEGSLEIEYEVGGYTITGSVNNLFGKDRLQLRLGDLKAKNLIELWINHLLLSTKGEFNSFCYFFEKKKGLNHVSIDRQDLDVDTELLKLIKIYNEAQKFSQDVLLPVETSREFAEQYLSQGDKQRAIEKASKIWANDSDFVISESEDFYNNLVFQNGNFLMSDNFQSNVLKIWTPILNSTGVIK